MDQQDPGTLPEKPAPKGLLRKLGTTINPWFRHYSTPGLWGVLISCIMIGGVLAIFLNGSACNPVKSVEARFEEKFGSYIQQKIFIETLKMRPPGLPDSVKRDVEMCTVYTGNYKPPQAQFWGDPAWPQPLDTDTCAWWPNDFIDDWGGEKAAPFKWCAKKDTFPPLLEIHGQKAPYANMHAIWEGLWPGYRCITSGEKYSKDCPNLKPRTTNPLTYIRQCGTKPWDPYQAGTWNKYDDTPAPGPPYVHGYQIRITTTSNVCPSAAAAFGAALGYVGYIEFVATLFIASFCVLFGISKPVHKSASLLNVLKGAGLTEDLERLENQAMSSEQNGASSKQTHVMLSHSARIL